MILRQKKKTEAEIEKSMGVSKRYYFIETGMILFAAVGMWFLGSVKQTATDRLLGNCVMAALGLAVVGYQFRKMYLQDGLDYNNREYPSRFWICLFVGLIMAFACGFLPVAGWPFLPLFVMLALFSEIGTGILAAAVLLLIAVSLSGAAVGEYALYLISGVFAIALFSRLKNDFKIGASLFLSVLCLLVCETANVVLVANARLEWELFLIPGANLVISTILLLGALKLFSSTVVYRYRDKYLDINDTEYPILAELRERDKQEYMHCVHTVYFCERIGKQLGLDVDALKTAGYYHKMGADLQQMMEEKQFPPAAVEILTEYKTRKNAVKMKETTVLLCADTIVTSITYFIKKGSAKVDYEAVIDAVFKKLLDDGSFNSTELSMSQLRSMQKIFKEEKLYYDFLR